MILVEKLQKDAKTWHDKLTEADQDDWWKMSFEDKTASIKSLVGILKMMKHTNSHAPDLLEVINKKHHENYPYHKPDGVTISCPRHISYAVSFEGFQLLQQV